MTTRNRRLEVWKQTLDPKRYEVHELGDTWAIVKEGSPGTWVLLRYDWQEPGAVHWSMVDTSYCNGGTGDITIVLGTAAGAGSTSSSTTAMVEG